MKTFRVYAPKLIDSSIPSIHAERIQGHTNTFIEYIEIKAEQIGDEYHTLEELYNHRLALNVAFFNFLQHMIDEQGYPIHVLKAKFHHDGTMFDGGYFIVMMKTVSNKQISYHYKLEHWDKFDIPMYENCPYEWDGHTPNDVIQRLLEL